MNIERDDIQIVSSNSNLTEASASKVLKDSVYNGPQEWRKFLQLLFLILGSGFTLSGIIFFFAYNWDDLHKFAKIGLIEALIIVTTSVVLFIKVTPHVRNIILTSSAVLVGVLFAVFGQIYQTGANAYDFFLAWAAFTTLWVLVSNYVPLWFLYLVLINTTFILYTQQVAQDWSFYLIMTILVLLNTIPLLFSLWLSKYKNSNEIPAWFINIIALSVVTYSTIGIVVGIFDTQFHNFLVLILCSTVLFALGVWHGVKTKSGFFLSIIPFSIITIISSLLLRISDDAGMFLVIGLFVVGCVTGIIRNLMYLQKKWLNEK